MSDALVDQHCAHCGDECDKNAIASADLLFCCSGCEMVYRILSDNGMTAYYTFEQTPGQSMRRQNAASFAFLDETAIADTLLSFKESNRSKITLHLPQIHCSSCLWLLENINRFDDAIISSRVNFLTKEATILYDHTRLTLRELAELMTKIGYEPKFTLDNLEKDKQQKKIDTSLVKKLGYAGFAFGNIMLLSFPEYLGFEQGFFKMYLGYFNILLAIPVLLFSGSDYIKSALVGIRQNILNINVPIALGMIVLFSRSVYEILSLTGEGYLDSFAGFVFFLLIGRWFQSYTHLALDFERGYQSYFPISATVWKDNQWTTKALDLVEKGDRLLIRNQELVPVDATLVKGRGRIDYSFVTGEADLISKSEGDPLLAGGKQMGSSIELVVHKPVDQSYLVQLWDEDAFKKDTISSSGRLIAGISKYFTYIIILLALGTMIAWYFIDPSKAFNVFTAVLIVACPCALALAIPFTYGNALRLFASRGIFLRNVDTIENIQDIDTIVFDKTGTITDNNQIEIQYEGADLAPDQKVLVKSSCQHSSHPLSKAIVEYFKDVDHIDIDRYEDIIGKGIITAVGDTKLKLGSANFIFGSKNQAGSSVLIEINGKYLGQFKFQHALRPDLEKVIAHIQQTHEIQLLSGDTDDEAERMISLFGSEDRVHFNQSPKDKLQFIKRLQDNGHHVMMIGDGLNDAGALKQSDVGLVISDNVNNFSPACDGILTAGAFINLHQLLQYMKGIRNVIHFAFLLAFLYNFIGLYFAMSGQLAPIIAAILMPASSITIIVYGIGMSYALDRFFFRKNRHI